MLVLLIILAIAGLLVVLEKNTRGRDGQGFGCISGSVALVMGMYLFYLFTQMDCRNHTAPSQSPVYNAANPPPANVKFTDPLVPGNWENGQGFSLNIFSSGGWNIGLRQGDNVIREVGNTWYCQAGMLYLTDQKKVREIYHSTGAPSTEEPISGQGYSFRYRKTENGLTIWDSKSTVNLTRANTPWSP